MRFFVHKRRQTPAIIIVALIDVLIVLVIFLVVTTTFKQQQQPAFNLTLPESTQAQRIGADENLPLVVAIDAKGDLRLGPEALPVTDERLSAELKERAAANPQLRVAISMDRQAPVGKFLKVRDIAIEAKIRNLMIYARETSEP